MSALTSTFRSYSQLLGIRGARSFVLAGFVGRFPISMRALAALLMVLAAHGSYTVAGAVSSVVALTNAVSAPFLGRLSDRRGQREVILLTLVVHVSGIVGLILLTTYRAPVWTLFVAAAVFGLSALPLGSLVRARWSALVGGTPRLQTAYALEAFIDDIIYLSGPVIVTMLAARLFPSAGLLVVLALVIVGWVALAMQRGTQPTPSPRIVGVKHTSLITDPGMRALLLVCLVLGAWLGSGNVAMVAFAQEQGNESLGGVLIGLMVFSGSVAGLVYGGVTWKASVVRRLLITAVMLGVGGLPLLIAGSIWWMALVALLAGVAITPTLISLYTLLSQLVAKTSVTEGFAWIACSITIGSSIGTAASGYLVDRAGSWAAYAFVVASGLAAPFAVAVTYRLLSRGPQHEQPPTAEIETDKVAV